MRNYTLISETRKNLSDKRTANLGFPGSSVGEE